MAARNRCGHALAAQDGMLLLNRFLSSSTTTLDLATGQPVRLRALARPSTQPLFTRRGAWRLIDHGIQPPRTCLEVWERQAAEPAHQCDCAALEAALADARDGVPRAVDLVVADPQQWESTVHAAARAATLAGFVPIQGDVLGEVLRAARWQWPAWLADRSLVVFTCDGRISSSATVALFRLASRDARPHIVVRGATSRLLVGMRLVSMAGVVHEDGAGPDVAGPAELAESVWTRVQAGDRGDDLSARARWALMLSPDEATAATARAALAQALVVDGRPLEARATLAGAAPAADPVDRHAADRLRQAARRLDALEAASGGDRLLTDCVLRVLEICQVIEDEGTGLGRVLALLREQVAASGLAVVSQQGTLPVTVLAQVGTEWRDLRVATPTLASGQANTASLRAPVPEGAWPIRYGGALVAALCVRWSPGLAVRPADADGLLGMAGLAVAPAVHAALHRGTRIEGTVLPELIGESDAMRTLRAGILRAAASPFPVLIEGESGSGKELVARSLHRMGPRRDRPFLALNCAALVDELAEAELFGHARGAFTGAAAERAGLFEGAHGGTLFLDEVSELSARVQAKLLRVLQEQEVRRLGESHTRRIDVRVVAASNRPLAGEAEAGRFRRDLRYRLDVVRLAVAPLRERLEDVPGLVQHIWSGLAKKTGSRAVLSPSALAALGRYDWPGNVRELQNVLAAVMVSSPTRGVIAAAHLPESLARVSAGQPRGTLAAARRAFEARYVHAALARANGRVAAAARELGVSRQGLAKLVARLNLPGEGVGRGDSVVRATR
jgi:DNA-binding NtrC family response regulator